MNKTSYEKEGLNSLNELFEKLIVCSEKQDKEGTLRIVSSLNDEEKDYLYTWATEQGKLDKVAGIVIKAEMDKKAFDINCRFKKALCEALVQNGYCLEGDPDVYNSDSFPFTDNKYINGEVIFDTRKVQLKARDAENRKYEKTIDYSSVGDLIESINHFRKDIEETFNKPEVVEEVVKEEPFDILGDKNFLKEIGADWVTDLIKKKAAEFVEVPKSDEEMHKLFERVLSGETLKFNTIEEVFLGTSSQKIDEGELYIYYYGHGSFAKEPTFENFKWILTEIINND